MEEEEILKEVEKLRNPYESDHEWRMRRDFMIVNYEGFPTDKLVCMANCYINIELHGCRYPLMVMGQINEMTEGLQLLVEREVTHKKKGVEMMQFVKASENESENKMDVEIATESTVVSESVAQKASVKVESVANKQTKNGETVAKKETIRDDKVAIKQSTQGKSAFNEETTNDEKTANKQTKEIAKGEDIANKQNMEKQKAAEASKIVESVLKKPMMNFVKASTDYKSTEESHQTPVMPPSFKTKFLEECQPKPVSHTPVAVANCASHVKTPIGTHLLESAKSEAESQAKEAEEELPVCPDSTALVNSFATMFKQYRIKQKAMPAVNVFHMTATKCRQKIDVKFENLTVKTATKFKATVFLEDIELAQSEDTNKKGAKNKAFIAAEEKLSKPCIKIVKINPEKMELWTYDSSDTNSGDISESEVTVAPQNVMPMGAPIPHTGGLGQLPLTPPNKKGQNKRKVSELHGDLTRFLIFEPTSDEQNTNAVAILRRSADASKAELDYFFHEDSTGTRCRLSIDGQVSYKSCKNFHKNWIENFGFFYHMSRGSIMIWTASYKKMLKSLYRYIQTTKRFPDRHKYLDY